MKFLKKHYKFFIFLLVCLVILLIYKNNNKNNLNYTALGDSFAVGEDSYGRIDYGYSDYLKDELIKQQKLNHYIKSFSQKTMSIELLYENIVTNKEITLKGKKYNLKQVLRESSILTLSIGLNDLIYQLSITNNLTDEKLKQIILEINDSFEKLITEIKKYYPYPIYVVGYYNIDPENELLSQAIQLLNQQYQKNSDVIFISTYDMFETNPQYRSNPDNIHPNRLGYQAIADKILTKIRKKLEN